MSALKFSDQERESEKERERERENLISAVLLQNQPARCFLRECASQP